MLKRKLCEAVFDWRLECKGPLLIADGRYEKPPSKDDNHYPDKIFISQADMSGKVLPQLKANPAKAPEGLPFYIPGTSLRGPFRSQAERIIRSLLPEDARSGKTACDPFEQDKQNRSDTLSCSKRLEGEPVKYRAACPACKLFGCAGLASRIIFEDAHISHYRSVYRDMIGIDRFTGGVYTGGESGGGANMRFHVLEDTVAATKIIATNFELWQLGLLAYVFRDFAEGLVPVGFGKTKGFGRVRATVKEITLTYPKDKAVGKIEHLGTLAAGESEHYDFYPSPAPDVALTKQSNRFGLYETYRISDLDGFWATVAPVFNQFLEDRSARGSK